MRIALLLLCCSLVAYGQLEWSAGAEAGAFLYRNPGFSTGMLSLKGVAQAEYSNETETGEYFAAISLRPEQFAGEVPFGIWKGLAELRYEGALAALPLSALVQNRYYRLSRSQSSLLSNQLTGNVSLAQGFLPAMPLVQITIATGFVAGTASRSLTSVRLTTGYRVTLGGLLLQPQLHFYRFGLSYTSAQGARQSPVGWGWGASAGFSYSGAFILSGEYLFSLYYAPFLVQPGHGHDVTASAGAYLSSRLALLFAASLHSRSLAYVNGSSREIIPFDPFDLENRVSCVLSFALSPTTDVNLGFGYILQDMTKFGYYLKGTEWTLGFRVSGSAGIGN